MTTSTETAAPAVETALDTDLSARQRRMPRFRVLFAAFVFGVILATGASGAGLYAYDRAHSGLIMPGVHVGAVDLSNLDAAAATSKLQTALAGYGQGSIVLSDGTTTDTVSYASLGRHADIPSLVDQALSVGRVGNVIDRSVDEVRTAVHGLSLSPTVSFDADAVSAAVTTFAFRKHVDPTDATAKATATGFTTTPSALGRDVDRTGAEAAISAALSDPASPASVTITLKTVPVTPSITDAQANLARARATAISQDLTITADPMTWTLPGATIKSWIRFSGVGADYGPVVSAADLTLALKPFAASIARPAKDAAFLIGKHGLIAGVTAAVIGRSLDIPGTLGAINLALAQRAAGSGTSNTLEAVVKTVAPKLTTEVAQQSAPLMRPISSWTTYYQSGAHNGFSANISIPSLTISGTVVAPGQWFSYWKAVGEVTLAKGYKLGGAIIGGRSVEGKTIGGGICSSSTTLFNAALRAGLQMGARMNHYYYISRYPKGLDATVFISDSGGAQDMTFRNDTPYPILIKAIAHPGIVTFTLYSVPTGRTVSLSTPIVKNYQPSTTIIEHTTTLRPGQTQQIEYEAAGFDAWVTRTVKDASGKTIHLETYFSHYGRVVGIVLVGVKKV
ncbi:MAG TPA: VanW family protein [Candidatus Acidoferrum sp.]|nr:VanW family protein [Candidatus Acidoferrum sp.]